MFYKDIVLKILEKYQENNNLGSEACRDQIAQEIEDEIIKKNSIDEAWIPNYAE